MSITIKQQLETCLEKFRRNELTEADFQLAINAIHYRSLQSDKEVYFCHVYLMLAPYTHCR